MDDLYNDSITGAMVQGHYPNMVEFFRLVNFSNLYTHIYIYACIYARWRGTRDSEVEDNLFKYGFCTSS